LKEALVRTEMLLGAEAMARLGAWRGIVFGTGGVGGWCVEALVRSGVRFLTLVDPDVVAPSNLNRQVMATVPTLGRPKAEVLADRLREIAPDAEITVRVEAYGADNALSFCLEEYDFVIDAIDSLDAKAHLVCHALSFPKVRFVSSMGAARKLDPTRVRCTRFEKVAGDALARALRQRFKRLGVFPSRSFTCAWSDEPAAPNRFALPDEPRANGSFMPVTAAFGLALAHSVIAPSVTRFETPSSP